MKKTILFYSLCFLCIAFINVKQTFSQPTQAWVQRHTFTVDAWDTSYAITLDNSGYAYITGTIWPNESVTSLCACYDYGTIKMYSSNGGSVWNPFVKLYDGTNNNNYNDAAYSIAVDGSANIYITGKSHGGLSTLFDFATIKYNSSGAQEWVIRYNGAGSDNDIGKSVTVDGSGNVYVAGYGKGSGTDYDYIIIKYNSSGTQQWVQTYDGSASGEDIMYAMVMDGSSNIYVTGYTTVTSLTSSHKDYTTVKYNSSGTFQWAQNYNGSSSGEDIARAICVDGTGNVYVTGRSYNSATTDYSFTTVKYNSSGTQQWASSYNGTAYNWDEGYSIAVDGSGNVYVTGKTWRTADSPQSDNFDYVTIKYNSSGTQQWASIYNGTASQDDEAFALAIDGSSNIYVTGRSVGSGTNFDCTTVKYNSSGTAVGGKI